MKVQCTATGDVSILTVSGEFVAELVAKFQDSVVEGFDAGRRDFLVDLSAAKALDSAALEALTALQRRTEEQLGMLHLCVTDTTIRKIFEITRLDQHISIHAHFDEAMAGFGGAAGSGGGGRS